MNEHEATIAICENQILRRMLVQATKALLLTGHKTDCCFSACTCGEIEKFKVEYGEFIRMLEQGKDLLKP